MRLHGVSLALISLFLPLHYAWEQHVFSPDDSHIQTITPQRHQPWSLLITYNINSFDCVVLRAPELAQTHRAIRNRGDVLVIKKSPSTFDGMDGVQESTLEIIGFDERILWTTTSSFCASIEHSHFSEEEELAEYEVVCICFDAEVDATDKATLFWRSCKSNRFRDDGRWIYTIRATQILQ